MTNYRRMAQDNPYAASRSADLIRRLERRERASELTAVPLGSLKWGRKFTVRPTGPSDDPSSLVYRVVSQGKATTEVIATNGKHPVPVMMPAGQKVYPMVEKERSEME